MGATYLSFQLRSTDVRGVASFLKDAIRPNPHDHLRFFLSEPVNGWLAVYPSFSLALERLATDLSRQQQCLVLTLLSVDEDDFYCVFDRNGRQMTYFKIGAGTKRYGKAKDKLASKLDLLSDYCDHGTRQALVGLLADTKDVIFSSDLLSRFCALVGIRNALTSFDYLDQGERDGIEVPCQLQRIPEHGG
jgi:hypothetical protein